MQTKLVAFEDFEGAPSTAVVNISEVEIKLREVPERRESNSPLAYVDCYLVIIFLVQVYSVILGLLFHPNLQNCPNASLARVN